MKHTFRSSHPRIKGLRGLTVLEVLIAVVVLSLTSASIVHLITAADRLRGRRISASHAVMAAHNEAELVRKNALYYDRARDTLYEVIIGATPFEVVRREVAPPHGVLGPATSLQEMEILVTDKRRNRTFTFRGVQGYPP